MTDNYYQDAGEFEDRDDHVSWDDGLSGLEVILRVYLIAILVLLVPIPEDPSLAVFGLLATTVYLWRKLRTRMTSQTSRFLRGHRNKQSRVVFLAFVVICILADVLQIFFDVPFLWILLTIVAVICLTNHRQLRAML